MKTSKFLCQTSVEQKSKVGEEMYTSAPYIIIRKFTYRGSLVRSTLLQCSTPLSEKQHNLGKCNCNFLWLMEVFDHTFLAFKHANGGLVNKLLMSWKPKPRKMFELKGTFSNLFSSIRLKDLHNNFSSLDFQY